MKFVFAVREYNDYLKLKRDCTGDNPQVQGIGDLSIGKYWVSNHMSKKVKQYILLN
jgi:hypothetical protein